MEPLPTTDRRRFLALTSTGAAGLAGCAELGSSDEGSESPLADAQGDSPGLDEDGVRTVSVIVQPNPSALQDAQSDVVSRLDDGEIDQEEAEQELAEAEQELIDIAISDASVRIDEVGGVHTDTVTSEGTLLVEGAADDILDLLEQPSVSAVLSADRFEQAEQRAGAVGDGDGERALPDELEESEETETESDDE